MDKADLLISVIIPAYNYAHHLPRALDSVLVQAAADVELIVVNDGSTDGTASVLQNYQFRNPGLRVIHQSNSGAAAARNRGVLEARGCYALMLDADDELVDGAIDCLRSLVEAQPQAGLFLGGQVSVFPDGAERLRSPSPVPAESPRQLIERYLLKKALSISHGCSLFRRDLLCERPYPEDLRKGEDIAVFAYLLVSAPVVTTARPLARIHKHEDSLRHSRENEHEYAMKMVERVFEKLPDECQDLRKRYMAQRYLSLFRSARNAGEADLAKEYYRKAFRLSPAQALRWTYLTKALSTFVRGSPRR